VQWTNNRVCSIHDMILTGDRRGTQRETSSSTSYFHRKYQMNWPTIETGPLC